MLLKQIRDSRVAKIISMFLALELIFNWFSPVTLSALTTGPTQPEVQSFSPVGTSDMVDVFSGDFSYNIPLLDVDGYPINISYNSGVTMDQEASWVGLGWNINPGAITRNMRGIPDDFRGDKITKRFNMKPNRSYGVSVGAGGEFLGIDAIGLNYSISVNYNSYRGVGFEQSLNMQFSAGNPAKGELTQGLGVTSSSDGLTLSGSLSFTKKIKKIESADVKGTGSIGLSFNSRSGLKKLSLNVSATETSQGKKRSNRGREQYTSSANGGSSIDFSMQTYTPQITMPMINTSFAISFKTGVHFFGLDGTANLSGYYSEQRLERNEQQIPAYGFMNSQFGLSETGNAIHDVNREKEGGFTENTPNLPITNYSYDVYSVAGQGVGGNYRPFRSDLGTVFDPAAKTYSTSANLGLEAGVGNLVHGGSDVSITDVTTTSGKWSSEDSASVRLKFRSSSIGNDPLFEAWYFKQAGEKAVDSDPSLFNKIGGSDPVQVRLKDQGLMKVVADTMFIKQFANSNRSAIGIPENNYRSSRQKRNQATAHLGFAQANEALQPSILDHTHPTMSAYNPATSEGQVMQLHHIGEISVLRSDGARYFYGLPAYNTKQQDITFNAQGRAFDCRTGIVTYVNGDNSLNNSLGIDNYYSMTETPAYAHSYLLTAIISPDYVDYDNVEGPSPADLGTYTKFKYFKAASNFKWRTPIGDKAASRNEGLKSETSDDKASIIYGEKEVWYLDTIETKNYIAVFTMSNREDGYGVNDTNGTVGGSALKKLDRIDLYSKPDSDLNGASATPIKSVYFEYDYLLCPGTPNRNPLTNGSGQSGKLTLKKIYFTYGNSHKAKLSSYNFTYADLDHNGTADVNYSYNLKGYDRWGGYMPNPTTAGCGGLDALSSAEFPYVAQDTTTADQYSAAWSLTSIDLPSGGEINVDYEADDYAYVQNKKAAHMFKITDALIDDGTPQPGIFSGAGTGVPTRVNLMNQGSYSNRSYYLYFKLQTPISSATSSAAIRATLLNDYLDNNLTSIYFRFLMDITDNSDYEYVSGYFDIDDAAGAGMGVGAPSSGYHNYAWIKVKNVPIGDREGSTECNPFCKAAWQFGRLQLQRKVWNQPDPQAGSVTQLLEAMAGSSFFKNILQTFKGPNRTIRDKGYGFAAVMQKSWIRLSTPNGKKLGGGSRVSRITISDNWKSMTNNSGYTPNDALYGQQYSYTINENGKTISSGVATYEPQIGGDENPFRKPVFFNEEKRLVPDDESYLEEPFGEMFFPGPGIGYSHVEVRNLQYANVKRHATGYTAQEFYTARDFPTLTRQTDREVKHKRTNPIMSLLKIKMKDFITASQGYVIETNDMHGKPKAQYVYAEGQVAPMSEVHYFYQVNPNNANQLDNTVNVIKKDGSVAQSLTGVDYDFVNDMREQQTKSLSGGLSMNLSGFLAGIFPCVIPSILPSWNMEHTRFRSTVITKVINRYGILVRTEAHDAGSTVTTENLGYDAETGELLVTKTKNNFDDPIYNFTYPAHWSYDRMGQAYKNLLTAFGFKTITSGAVTVAGATNYFVPGDEVGVKSSTGTFYKAWVCSVSGSTVNLIDKDGIPLVVNNNPCILHIIRSGRRNQQAMAVGGVTLMTCPLVDNNSDGKYDAINYDKVLNAKAQEYDEKWMMFGGHTGPDNVVCTCVKSTLYGWVSNLMVNLQNNGALLTSGTLLYDGVTYYHGYTPDLNASLPAGNVYWYPTVNGQVLTGLVAGSPSGPGCTITMQLPAPHSFSNIDSLSLPYPISNPSTCSSGYSYEFYTDVKMLNGQRVYATGSTTCWQMGMMCSTVTPITSVCGKVLGDTVNPYFQGILGTWRPLRSQLYLASRYQSTASNNTDIRKDGYFITKDHSTGSTIAFQPFWSPNGGNDWTKDSTYWTWSSEVTKYTPNGNEVENRDALNRYSCAVFGYRHTLPIAVASNAQYQEIAYDGFEDYDFIDSTDCRRLHFNFYESRAQRSNIQAHTGLYSIKVEDNDSVTAKRHLTHYKPLAALRSCPYLLTENDFVGTFSPITFNGDKTYVLNYWVKETGIAQPVFNYPDASAFVKFINGAGAITFPTMTLVQKSDIIEGWQQYQYTFVIPGAQSGAIAVVLKNTNATGRIAYFDDVRLHPFDSNMKSYVYNPLNLRFTYELDENNYSTIYEYDEDGTLVRVKKETTRGIMTIKESRNNTAH